jgi:hypothetical protein
VALLDALSWLAVDLAARTRPEPEVPGRMVSVMVVVDSGPVFRTEPVVAVGILLLGAAATVLACASLNRETA